MLIHFAKLLLLVLVQTSLTLLLKKEKSSERGIELVVRFLLLYKYGCSYCKYHGGAIANALAFTSSQVVARALDGDAGSLEEVKQHNAALEQLQKAEDEYNQKCADVID